jgi:hypothetical protein
MVLQWQETIMEVIMTISNRGLYDKVAGIEQDITAILANTETLLLQHDNEYNASCRLLFSGKVGETTCELMEWSCGEYAALLYVLTVGDKTKVLSSTEQDAVRKAKKAYGKLKRKGGIDWVTQDGIPRPGHVNTEKSPHTPSWEWKAMNEDGNWCLFEQKPTRLEHVWTAMGNGKRKDGIEVDWRDTVTDEWNRDNGLTYGCDLKWAAMDKNGVWFLYRNKPRQTLREWDNAGGDWAFLRNGGWKYSLSRVKGAL